MENPPSREWRLNARGVAKYGDFGPIERNGATVVFWADYVQVVKDTPILSAAEM